ncbi:hypothetical protein CROQUDRAFT_43731, partial [Cronartium quercuum f. sp. fusiforme G11]
AIILLSFVLALGFLLVILSCALWGQWLPLLVAAIFFSAPLPKLLASSCGGTDEFSADYSSTPAEAAEFFTGCLLMTGVALPLVLAHSEIITQAACFMSMSGGGLVYSTIIVYTHFFSPRDEF